MTWLFAALWKLPASNSSMKTAEAQECVYGSVGGPKRPRSKLSLSRMYLFCESASLPSLGCCQSATQENAFEIVSECPFADRAFSKRTWIAGRRIPRAGECPDRQSPQVAI